MILVNEGENSLMSRSQMVVFPTPAGPEINSKDDTF